MRFARLAALSVFGLAQAVQAAEPDPYIFDVLALQPYKGNFARLVKAKDAPDWVKAIAIQGAGTAGPMKTVEIGGTPYRLDRVCKVDACAGHTLDVLWAPRGAKVWAALVEDGRPPVMLGTPKGEQEKALEAASAAVSPAATAPAVGSGTAIPPDGALPPAPSAPLAPATPATR